MHKPFDMKSKNLLTLIKKLESILDPILDESGTILFSSIDTLKKGDLYTLGLNPGGGAKKTIRTTINELPNHKNNAYIDECWENKRAEYKIGHHPLQKNYNGLINALGYRTESVFGTNLIFSRSRNQKGAKYEERANICWNVHKVNISVKVYN